MVVAKIIVNEHETDTVILNQRHICSFKKVELHGKECTEVKMSNGDKWIVIEPDFQSWSIDAFIDKENVY